MALDCRETAEAIVLFSLEGTGDNSLEGRKSEVEELVEQCENEELPQNAEHELQPQRTVPATSTQQKSGDSTLVIYGLGGAILMFLVVITLLLLRLNREKIN